MEDDVSSKIREMIRASMTVRDMHYVLQKEGINISYSYLKRKVVPDVRRSLKNSNLETVISAIQDELKSATRSVGCNELLQVLRMTHGIYIPRDLLRVLLRVLDPDGVSSRKRRRLVRREYRSKGPSYIWHLDGYDKLSPFGICIHGCIDGFSRRLLWLKCGASNSNPKIIGKYYLDAIKENEGSLPKIVRADPGTENVIIRDLQILLHNKDADAYISSKSVHNQRIERWWSFLRSNRTDWWITYFKDMVSDNLYTGANFEKKLIQYLYVPIIQQELDELRERWNTHRIRKQRKGDVVCGVPNLLFYHSEKYAPAAVKYECKVREDDLKDAYTYTLPEDYHQPDNDITIVCRQILTENGLDSPKDHQDAKDTYILLRESVKHLFN